LSLEIGIVVDSRITSLYEAEGGKADAIQRVEGSSPGHAMASVQDTTGVRERGMYLRGQLGNLGEPFVSLLGSQKMRGTG